MSRYYAANNWMTTLAEAIDNSVTSFDVASVAGAPDTPFKITVENEIMDVIDITGFTLTVDRGREGTNAVSHANGTPVEHRFTAGTLNELWGDYEDHKANYPEKPEVLFHLIRPVLLPFESLDNYTQVVTGSGSVTGTLLSLQLTTGATINSTARVTHNTQWYFTTAAKTVIAMHYELSNIGDVIVRMHLSQDSPTSDTSRHIGFKILNNKLYASNGDGTNGTLTEIQEFSAAHGNHLMAVLSTTECRFYRNFTLAAVHTTNLPSNVASRFTFEIENTAEANKLLRIFTAGATRGV